MDYNYLEHIHKTNTVDDRTYVFDDLIFQPHHISKCSPEFSEAVQAKQYFRSGAGISVIGGCYLFHCSEGTYEVAVLGEAGIEGRHGGIIGYLSPQDITDLMLKLQYI